MNRRLASALILLSGLTPSLTPAEVGRWTSIGPTLITSGDGPEHNAVGRVTSIAIHPQSTELIYVGARGSGVWKTTNGGASWTPLTDSLPTLTVSGLAIAPSRPDRVYLATPSGIFRSDNAGASWTQTNTALTNVLAIDGGAMLVHPTNADLVFANTCGDPATGGVQRSDDGGVTWRVVLAGACGTGLVMDRRDPRKLEAAVTSPADGRSSVYESVDGGATWARLAGCPDGPFPSPGEATLRLARSDDRLFVSFKHGAEWSLFRTTGRVCTVSGRPDVAWEAGWVAPPNDAQSLWSYIQADPADSRFVYATGTVFRISTDGGTTFQTPSSQPHVDFHGFAFDPANPSVLFVGSDGGIYKSSNRGQSSTWSFIGEGLANVEFYDIADSAKEPNVVIGGTHDNGTSRFNGSSTVWRFITGGDSEGVEISESDPKRLYEIGQWFDHINVSTDGGASFRSTGDGLPAKCDPWLGEFPADPGGRLSIHTGERLLVGCNALWQGTPWTSIHTVPNDSVSVAVIDPRTNIYIAGTSSGKLVAGLNGANFSEMMTSIAGRRASDIKIDRGDPSVVYASFLGLAAGRVYRLKRLSVDPPRYSSSDVTSNLPANLHVKTLAVDRLVPFSLFAGTDRGVYRARSVDQGVTWTWSPYNTGLPAAVDVRDLELHPVTGVLRAGTFGRGTFEVLPGDPLGSVLQATGRISLLRVHEAGSKYGPPDDQIDADVVIQLDTMPEFGFGFTLRPGATEADHQGMLDRLRDAFRRNRSIVIDYERTGFRNNRLLRVMN